MFTSSSHEFPYSQRTAKFLCSDGIYYDYSDFYDRAIIFFLDCFSDSQILGKLNDHLNENNNGFRHSFYLSSNLSSDTPLNSFLGKPVSANLLIPHNFIFLDQPVISDEFLKNIPELVHKDVDQVTSQFRSNSDSNRLKLFLQLNLKKLFSKLKITFPDQLVIPPDDLKKVNSYFLSNNMKQLWFAFVRKSKIEAFQGNANLVYFALCFLLTQDLQLHNILNEIHTEVDSFIP